MMSVKFFSICSRTLRRIRGSNSGMRLMVICGLGILSGNVVAQDSVPPDAKLADSITIRFAKADPADVAHVLNTLTASQLLRLQTIALKPGEKAAEKLVGHLGMPKDSASAFELALEPPADGAEAELDIPVVTGSQQEPDGALVISFALQDQHTWSAAKAELSSGRFRFVKVLPKIRDQIPDNRRIVARFQGGDIKEDIDYVLRSFLGLRLINTTTVALKAGDTVYKVYQDLLGVPVSLIDLAATLNNKNYEKHTTSVGETLIVPDAKVTPYVWTWRLSDSIIKDRLQAYTIRHNKVWKSFLLSEAPLKDGGTEFSLRGYQLEVYADDDDQLEATRNLMVPSKSRNLVLILPPPKGVPAKHFSTGASATISELGMAQYLESFNGSSIAKLPLNSQGTLSSYLGMEHSLNRINNCGEHCPEIILIDQRVSKHPNLSFTRLPILETDTAELVTAEPQAIDGKADVRILDKLPYKDEHGTHMAGIISGRRTGFGVIGINPEASLYSLDWDNSKQDPFRIQEVLQERKDSAQVKGEQIYVIATEWTMTQMGKSDEPCSQRFRNEALADFFANSNRLVVVAAGNEVNEPGSAFVPAEQLTTNLVAGPRNMGDCPNVLVVTACDLCDQPSARVPEWANFSSQLVHLAAFGGPVLSTAGAGSFAFKRGTSQSAGFVAGVASAMVSAWPDVYLSNPSRVKFRLQVTATPNLLHQESQKLTSGVINPDLALKDPRKDWFAASGATINAATNTGIWCTDKIRFGSPGSRGLQTINVNDVYRISCRSNGCVFYTSTRKERSNGVIQRTDLGQILDPGKSLFQIDGRLYSSPQFSELVLADPMKVGVCK